MSNKRQENKSEKWFQYLCKAYRVEKVGEDVYKFRSVTYSRINLFANIKRIVKKERKQVETYLIRNARFINITGIEKENNYPKGLVQKFLKYGKKINDKHIPGLLEIVNSMRK